MYVYSTAGYAFYKREIYSVNDYVYVHRSNTDITTKMDYMMDLRRICASLLIAVRERIK